MMAIHFDNVTMPEEMTKKGALTFNPPEALGYDGEGRPILAPTRTATWAWAQLYPSEADWILQTLLGGARYRPCFNGIRLYDPLEQRTEQDFSYAIVDAPTWERATNSVYYNVKLQIRDILP
jgi:hypothetical protein